MMKIKRLKIKNDASSELRGSADLFMVYDVGEITKVDLFSRPYGELERRFFDSKGLMFTAPNKVGYSRDLGSEEIWILEAGRRDIIPSEYRKTVFSLDPTEHIEIRCIDPRVLWVDMVSAWALWTGRARYEEIGEIITENLPTIQEAAEWLKRNKFEPFSTSQEEFGNAKNYGSKYHGDPAELLYPPEIDWERYNLSVPEGRGIMGKD